MQKDAAEAINPGIKICGITRVADACFAARNGASLIGLNVFSGPRQISLPAAMDFAAAPGVRGKVVLLLADSPAAWTASPPVMGLIHGVQFYGPPQSPAIAKLKSLGLRIYLPVSVHDAPGVNVVMRQMDELRTLADAWLIDSHVPGQRGGTGKPFDWRIAKPLFDLSAAGDLPPLGLAGGLTAENVAAGVAALQPAFVDVSSGVEEAGRPGIKSEEKILAFVRAVRSAGGPTRSAGGE